MCGKAQNDCDTSSKNENNMEDMAIKKEGKKVKRV